MNNKERLDFGDFCEVASEQPCGPAEMVRYKVIARMLSAYYHDIPVLSPSIPYHHGIAEDCIACVCDRNLMSVMIFRTRDVVRMQAATWQPAAVHAGVPV